MHQAFLVNTLIVSIHWGEKMKAILKLFAVAAFGAICYGIIENVERGYSHITMGALGGVSMIIIHELNGERHQGRIGIFAVLIISMLFITSGELLAGEILNRRLGMKIWNYHEMPLNFDGQICLLYSLIWLFLSLFGMVADDLIRRFIFFEPISNDPISKRIE